MSKTSTIKAFNPNIRLNCRVRLYLICPSAATESGGKAKGRRVG